MSGLFHLKIGGGEVKKKKKEKKGDTCPSLFSILAPRGRGRWGTSHPRLQRKKKKINFLISRHSHWGGGRNQSDHETLGRGREEEGKNSAIISVRTRKGGKEQSINFNYPRRRTQKKKMNRPTFSHRPRKKEKKRKHRRLFLYSNRKRRKTVTQTRHQKRKKQTFSGKRESQPAILRQKRERGRNRANAWFAEQKETSERRGGGKGRSSSILMRKILSEKGKSTKET